jgi:mono/diheme cytochrome c family protein
MSGPHGSVFARIAAGSALLVVLAFVLAACGTATEPAPSGAAVTEAAPGATAVPAPTESGSAIGSPASAQLAAAGYAEAIQPIFDQSCTKCHSGDAPKGGLSLKTYDDLMKGGKDGAVVIAGDAQGSMLVQLVSDGNMPKNAPPLPQAEIDTISAWIDAGATND